MEHIDKKSKIEMQEDQLELARKTIVEAARSAGKMLKEHWSNEGEINLEFKGDTNVDIVTQCDKKAEDIIISLFTQRFPDWDILAEESGKHNKEGALFRWIIDPLDGTTSFAHGHPCFSVSIGLQDIKKNEIILGCVYSPTLDELFFAEKGKGATKNGKPIHVSKKTELIHSLVASGFPYDRKQCKDKIESNLPYFNSTVTEIRGFRRNGSAAIDMVAFFFFFDCNSFFTLLMHKKIVLGCMWKTRCLLGMEIVPMGCFR